MSSEQYIRSQGGVRIFSRMTSVEKRDLKGALRRCELCGCSHEDFLRLVVDHDHETDVIRGLLCSSCNRHVGLFECRGWRSRSAPAGLHEWVRRGKIAA